METLNHLYCLSLTIHKGLQINNQFQSIGIIIMIIIYKFYFINL
jgi:hypothetical protein